jgi:thiol-disulfide isomerase/thioredoxin
MSKPTTHTRNRPAARSPRPRRPARRTNVLPILLGVVVAMAAIAIAIGVASRSGDDGTTVAQNREVVASGRALTPYAGTAADPAVGQPIPDLRGEGFDGRTIDVAGNGTPKLIIFLAHWCPHCQAEVPRVVDWLAASGTPQGVELVAVSSGVDRNRPNYPPSSWLEREGWTIPTIADDTEGTAATMFGLTGYPYFVAVDGQGRVAARASGELSVGELEALLAKARG